jgi:hypothetical protein
LPVEADAATGACFARGAVAGRGKQAAAAGAGAGKATRVEAADFAEGTDFEPGAALGSRAPPPEAEGAEEAAAEAGRELGCGLEAGRGF